MTSLQINRLDWLNVSKINSNCTEKCSYFTWSARKFCQLSERKNVYVVSISLGVSVERLKCLLLDILGVGPK